MKKKHISDVEKRLSHIKKIEKNLSIFHGVLRRVRNRMIGVIAQLDKEMERLEDEDYSEIWERSIGDVKDELWLMERLTDYLIEIEKLTTRLNDLKKCNCQSVTLMELTEETINLLMVIVDNYEQTILDKVLSNYFDISELNNHNHILSIEVSNKRFHDRERGNSSKYSLHEVTIIEEIESFLNARTRDKVLKKELPLNIVQAIHGKDTNEVPPSKSTVDGWLKTYKKSNYITIFKFNL